jgi:phosphoribosyl 1,2-cyclic phosphate phosphodiesterase
LIITFLGTGTSQGVPVIACQCEVCQSIDFRDKRLRTSILIEAKDKTIVIDSGPDFRQQMLRERVKKMDALIFTHEHKDHTAGMDDVRAFNFKQQMDMPVYARKQVIEQLKREFAYVFAEKKYPGVPTLEIHEIENIPFSVQGITFIPIEVLHYKLPVFGFRIGDFSYVTDANYISETEKEKLKGSKVLILNALQKQAHISHFNLDQAIKLAEELKPQKAYFTHISHKLGFHEKVSQELPDNIELAYDGLKINLPD